MVELSENHKAFFRRMNESRDLEWHGFRLLLKREDFADFFDVLKDEGFFGADRNPGPQESEDLVHVPYWPALDYLRACAERSSQSNDTGLAEKVMAVVREVSLGHDGTFQDNSHTAKVFAEIIGMLPRSVVRLDDIEYASRWVKVRFSNGMVAHVLDKGALLSFLDSDDRNDWLKALKILRYCTEFRWKEENPVPVVEADSLARLVEHHAGAIGNKLRADAVELFAERVREVFSRGGRERWSYVFRPAIEKHAQNRRSKDFENCLVAGLRDALLAWSAVDVDSAREYVKSLLGGDTQILRRIGIYVLNERWADLSVLYADAVGPGFFQHAHIHELFALLEKRFESLSQEVKEKTLESIRALPGPEGQEADRVRKLAQLRWLYALKETRYEPAVTLRRELQEETEAGELEYPDFNTHMEVRVGPGPSPYQVAELVAFADAGIIAEKLNDFHPSESRRGPTREGLVAALESAVAASPETFIRALPLLLDARSEYRYGILCAVRALWDKSKQSHGSVAWESIWPQMFSFLEALIEAPGFWKQVNEQDREHGQGWVASAIADLLERGTRDDGHAYPEELLPRGLGLIGKLLAYVKPTADADAEDPMFAAINTRKGRALEALFAHALRCCRISDQQSGSHDGAWSEVQPLFDKELARCKGTNYEFSTLAGAYLSNLDYMNAQWVETNLRAIFSDDPAAFVAAIAGLAYSHPTRRLYELLRNAHIIDQALAMDLRSPEIREKLIERIMLAFIGGEEPIDSPIMTFPFERGVHDDIESAASFLWMIRGEQVTDAQRDKIIEYWSKCIKWAATQETPSANLFDALGHLTWALRDVEGDNRELLLAVVPRMPRRHNLYGLLEELNRLATMSPSGVADVLRSIVDTHEVIYDYEDRLKTLIQKLEKAGERGAAIYCTNKLITLPGMDELYEQLTTNRAT